MRAKPSGSAGQLMPASSCPGSTHDMSAVPTLAANLSAPAPPPRSGRWVAALGGWFLLIPAAILLGGFFIYPVAKLLLLSAVDGSGQPTLVQYARLFGSSI